MAYLLWYNLLMLPSMSPSQPPMGGAPEAEQASGASPEQLKATLIKVLQQVAKVAQQNGLDFNELVSAVQTSARKPVPPPAPMP